MLTGSDSVMPMASQALESVSVIPMASPTGSALASELEPRLDSGRKSESPMVSASDSGLEPESLAWASESVPGLEPEMPMAPELAPQLESAPGLESDLTLASVMPMASRALESASELESRSDSWLAPELLAQASELESRSDSGLEPDLASVPESELAPELLARASESVPGLEPESALASGRDRTRHRRQIPSALSWR